MAFQQPIRILVVTILAWMASSQVAIAHPWDELESPNFFFTATEMTPQVAVLGLAVAFGFGAIHALAPGHGKTMVAAYLVGNRGTARHALLLGIVTTISHTLSVLGLAVLALVASQYILPEQLYPILSTLSGLTVLGVGLWLFRQSWTTQDPFKLKSHAHDAHPHEHHAASLLDTPHAHHIGHHHDVDHVHEDSTGCSCGHSHPPLPNDLSLKSLVALGIAGGMVPCPSALVLLLSAIAFHQVAYGIVLVSGFSLGLASVLIALGLTVVYAKNWFEQLPNQTPWLQYLPMASASMIILIGIVLTGFAMFPAQTY